MMFRRKKGSIFDIILFLLVIFALGLIIIVGSKAFNIIDEEFDANPDISTTAKELIEDNRSRYVNLFNGIFLTFFILMPIALIVGAYFIDVPGIFFVASIFISIFLVLIGGAFSNVYEEISTDTELSEEAASFTAIDFIMSNYVKFTLFIVFLVIIATYAKNKDGL